MLVTFYSMYQIFHIVRRKTSNRLCLCRIFSTTQSNEWTTWSSTDDALLLCKAPKRHPLHRPFCERQTTPSLVPTDILVPCQLLPAKRRQGNRCSVHHWRATLPFSKPSLLTRQPAPLSQLIQPLKSRCPSRRRSRQECNANQHQAAEVESQCQFLVAS